RDMFPARPVLHAVAITDRCFHYSGHRPLLGRLLTRLDRIRVVGRRNRKGFEGGEPVTVSRRIVLCVALLAGCIAGGAAQAGAPRCDSRILVLSAMPVELGPLLAQTTGRTTVTYDGHDFYLGRL